MKFVGLISGGKDSIFNLLQCISYGHELVCVANLHAPVQREDQEMDSFMFQTVGVEIADQIAQCLEVPIIKAEIRGQSLNQELYYEKDEETKLHDEVEDFYQLIVKVKEQYPEVQAVASGAIFSNYQRLRVENVCQRLGLISLAYLWLRDQSELLQEMVDHEMDARIVKICSMGLKPAHLGKSITQLYSYFITLRDQFQFNVCGEGGEYESAVFDCPIFKNKKIVPVQQEIITHSDSFIAPVAYLKYTQFTLEDKSEEDKERHREILENLISERKFLGQAQPIQEFLEYPKIKLNLDQQLDLSEVNEQFIQTANHLTSLSMSLSRNTLKVTLYIADMSQFVQLNKVYQQYFGLKPPVRVCVELCPDINNDKLVYVQVICACDNAIERLQRQNLHVQGFSNWAPANIGPYSQANMIGQFIFLAGNIGLIPELMVLENTLEEQYQRILKNFNAILETIDKKLIKTSCITAIIYLRKGVELNQALSIQIQNDFQNIPITVLVVEDLPRQALIEIELLCVRDLQLVQTSIDKKQEPESVLVKKQNNLENSISQVEEEEKESFSPLQSNKEKDSIQPHQHVFIEIVDSLTLDLDDNQINDSNQILGNIKLQLEKTAKYLHDINCGNKESYQVTIYLPICVEISDSNESVQLIEKFMKFFRIQFEEVCERVLVSVVPVYQAYQLRQAFNQSHQFNSRTNAIVWKISKLEL
eukprot:403367470